MGDNKPPSRRWDCSAAIKWGLGLLRESCMQKTVGASSSMENWRPSSHCIARSLVRRKLHSRTGWIRLKVDSAFCRFQAPPLRASFCQCNITPFLSCTTTMHKTDNPLLPALLSSSQIHGNTVIPAHFGRMTMRIALHLDGATSAADVLPNSTGGWYILSRLQLSSLV
jgi:hypothetical protein